jgi:hypothetical protein
VRRNSHGQPGKSSSGVYSKIKLEDLSQLASETAAPAACGPGVSERGGEGAGGGGGAWGRAPGAARVLLFDFFFSTRSARGARTKITPILGKNHARVEIIDLISKSQAPVRDFAYLGAKWGGGGGSPGGVGSRVAPPADPRRWRPAGGPVAGANLSTSIYMATMCDLDHTCHICAYQQVTA